MKCLEKEPHKRYGTAALLADDLGRWLAGEPIEARPASRPERVVRWCRRNPLVASLSFLTVASLVGVATVATLGYLTEADLHAAADGLRVRAEDSERETGRFPQARAILSGLYRSDPRRSETRLLPMVGFSSGRTMQPAISATIPPNTISGYCCALRKRPESFCGSTQTKSFQPDVCMTGPSRESARHQSLTGTVCGTSPIVVKSSAWTQKACMTTRTTGFPKASAVVGFTVSACPPPCTTIWITCGMNSQKSE